MYSYPQSNEDFSLVSVTRNHRGDVGSLIHLSLASVLKTVHENNISRSFLPLLER